MGKTKAATLVIMALNIVLLAVLIIAAVDVGLSARSGEAAAPPAGETPTAMGESEQAADGQLDAWIDNMKYLAQKHGVDAYFLQELFPEQIVYWAGGQVHYDEVNPALPMHPYNWEHLQKDENGVLRYAEPGGLEGIFGIDVSQYQGDIDWEKVKAAGVGFAILRVGYRGYGTGDLTADENFADYLEGATKADIPVGVYFFSQAVNAAEAAEEADYIVDAVAGYDIRYPLVFDMEEIAESPNRTENLTPAEVTDIAIAFCERVRERGYRPMIYGNVSWFLAKMELARLDDYDKWFAQYRPRPWYPYEFDMWQYTHTGSIEGIAGDVDLNISFVDYAAG